MGNKAEELFEVWKSNAWTAIGKGEWKEAFKDVRTVSQKDVNGFLRLVRENVDFWPTSDLGKFVSFVLEECYKGKFIELDVNLVEGEIDVGRELNWDGVVYVEGDVEGSVGYGMKKGVIVVEGNVGGHVGWCMEGGEIYIEGNVREDVGNWMEKGTIVVDGDVGEDVGDYMSNGMIIVNGFVGGFIGYSMTGGEIIINGDVKWKSWAGKCGEGLIICNGFVYFGRKAR